jgi:TolB-like protein/Tfp pilus assembly protein PilF
MALVIVFLVIDNYVLKEAPEITMEPVTTSTVAKTVAPAPTTFEKAETTAPPNSIAVLPFANMSPDKDQDYFADGIAEEILNSLARIKDLEVRGRTSSFYFKGRNDDLHTISEMLNVKYILEGSVRKARNQVRITVQMINTQSNEHLWSKTYDRTLDDIFTIQEDIAKSVANSLEITLGVGELGRDPGMTRNVEAYDAYLAGRSLSYRTGGGGEYTAQTIEHLEQAVALDPGFATAWSDLADIYSAAANLYIAEKAEEYNKKAEAAVSRAITLAPDSAASLQAAAQLHERRHEWTQAEALRKKALEMSSVDVQANILYSRFLMMVGRPDDAIAYDQRAIRAEPLFPGPSLNLGLDYELNGNLDATLKQYERTRELVEGISLDLESFILVLAMGMNDRALMEIQFEKMGMGNDDQLTPENRLGHTLYSLLDKPLEARTTLHNLYEDPAYQNPFVHGVVIPVWASYFGDPELALKATREAKNPEIYTIWRPIHKAMRRLPGFKDLVRDLKLVDYWRTNGNWGKFCHPVGEDDFECE